MLMQNFATAPKIGSKIYIFAFFFYGIQSCGAVFGTLSENVFLFASFVKLASFFGGGSCFIHFGATVKDLGHLGLWDCGPFLRSHTTVHQWYTLCLLISSDPHATHFDLLEPAAPVQLLQLQVDQHCRALWRRDKDPTPIGSPEDRRGARPGALHPPKPLRTEERAVGTTKGGGAPTRLRVQALPCRCAAVRWSHCMASSSKRGEGLAKGGWGWGRDV